MIQLVARLALVLFAIWAASTVFEPGHHAARLEIAADSLEHALISLGLFTLASAALPKINLLWIGLAVLGLGLGLELLQFAQVAPGRFELRDILADYCGMVVGWLAVAVGEARSGHRAR